MKTKQALRIKKQSVTVKDLKTRKNPKGGVAFQASSLPLQVRIEGLTETIGARR
jgi:hypothetical protein